LLSCAEAEVRGKIELVSKDCESAWVVEGARAYPPARSVRPLASKNDSGFFAFADEDEMGFVAYPLRAPSLKVGLAGLTPSETEMGSRVDSSRAAIVAIRFDSKVDVLPKYEV
jgi:hypothetical protein